MNSYAPAQTLTADTHAQAVAAGFWQHPFVQNVLPFLTSMMPHFVFIVIGFGFFYTFKEVITRPHRAYFGSGGSTIMMDDSTVLHPIPGASPFRDAAQDKFPDVPPDSKGWAETPGEDMTPFLSFGGSDGQGTSGLISIGSRGCIGVPLCGGSSGKGGPLAPFGIPGGGGGMGVKFIGMAVCASRIVFVCDATGSMMCQFDNLRVELRKAVEGLRVPQAMSVVFFQENAVPPISKSLLLATPGNKQKIYDFVDKYTPRGPTDPIPAVKAALAMHPDLIFFLCDPSDFPDPKAVGELFRTLNADHKCRVNTISFLDESHEGEELLKQISADSGGKFKYVSEEEMGK